MLDNLSYTKFCVSWYSSLPFKTKVYTRPKSSDAGNFTVDSKQYYQVLIHRGDWSDMMLPVDQTSYLAHGTNLQDKIFSTVNGLDCVDHSEIIPYMLTELPDTAIDHPMIEQFFELESDDDEECSEYKLMCDMDQLRGENLTPQCVYKETTDAVEVQIMTYYLGTTMRNGQTNYCWRFAVRVQNLECHCPLILSERNMKIYTLAGLRHVNMSDEKISNKPLPYLGPNPAYQFSDHIMLTQAKGGQLWGRLKMEKDDGSFFDCPVPTVLLDVPVETGKEKMENRTQ
uniref:ApaG domain-containing protein n=1 Tax=Ditylenchus dipsaci TaxID=166011 RepID=A0A915D6P4_9BILA